MWCAKSNFICLLNLPDTMRRYGPLRLLWEGGDCGEGVLCTVKPLVSGLTGRWQEASHLRYAKCQAIDKLRSIEDPSLTHPPDVPDLIDDENVALVDVTLSHPRYGQYR